MDLLNAARRRSGILLHVSSLPGAYGIGDLGAGDVFQAAYANSTRSWAEASPREIVSTVEIEENFNSMGLSNFAISFLADDLVRLRYASINGQLRKMLLVVKMRRSSHGIDMYEYAITPEGMVMWKPLRGYRGLTSDIPEPWSAESGQNRPEPRPTPTAEAPPPPTKESS